MRGKDLTCDGVAGVYWITPAYAGKSRRKLSRSCTVQDHPRLCGEKIKSGFYRLSHRGSPPPMRGKEPHFRRFLRRHGITPAYAGKRLDPSKPIPQKRDHPRLCGEKHSIYSLFKPHLGSPPPMRGKDPHRPHKRILQGITPAYAGKSVYDNGAVVNTSGSPPPMRGKAADLSVGRLEVGITPAYAGKRKYTLVHQDYLEDHPRLCGEKFVCQHFQKRKPGSPPPMRGKATKT